ncbi:NADH dehydrogenase [ubiquinone] 1 subunit C1, mitochondrial-like [Heteronotia binoei]|uniref:NADH dehydrogenase [ubiquinone] 1 subunit C1, mitochondrial-like n=1 Tax=Heteronotia binoei TaxID=13085 RepID=UPI0029311C8C|nr:NADH dehydrogenase [ubiquinone] 1 subunit C1, mitochondrial-like [Heteronotia binoei]XP_060102723.1 NADH dehydrogenase [ubiquinone] 1 subunit C1, mitochondrial-like [Heteronotia binoei]XP_060102743.1 NADH dehydrogenase [ubiquinone] 1 subunit C1, mitochondrial-like [Heteronotia binoei]XP_060102745.1 NADH dehydrogenase [ubiquinone] 1 subunit C1, mitochondrial-like [Heteronotia binoei]
MAAPLQALQRFLRLSGTPTPTLSRSAFTARKDDSRNPDWLKVGVTVGSTIAIWVLLLKQHNDDIREYERRKAERECS